jgi:glycosidase
MIRRLSLLFLGVLLISGAAWAEFGPDDSIYFLFTDRFYDGDESNNYTVNLRNLTGYHGGDFAGLEEKLPYIADMGFSAIWISSVVDNQSGGYHGYWARDYYSVEEHFGDMESLKSMVDRAHELNLKVIVDLAINHTGLQSLLYADETLRDSWFNPRRDIEDGSDRFQMENHWLQNLPDLNHNNPEVRRYLIDMSIWWIEQTGIDGYRLDAVRHVPADFWAEFSAAIKERFPGFYLIGEVFDGNPAALARYQRWGIDGLLDFPMYFAVRDMVRNGETGTRFNQAVLNARQNIPFDDFMGTFIDNHDVPRFVNQVRREREEKLAQALMFLFTYTGIPVMYYGTELPMDGGAEHTGRAMMDWETEPQFRDLVTVLNGLRADYPALTEGDFDIVKRSISSFAFARWDEDEVFITVLNNADEDRRLDIEIPEEMQRDYRWALPVLIDENGEPVAPGVPDLDPVRIRRGEIRLNLPEYTGVVIRLSESRD